MQRAFYPTTALLNRIGYTKKFTLLWLLSMAAVAVMIYSLFVNLDRIIQPSHQRLEGLTLIEPITHAMQALQLHRGLSAALLGGNESLRDARAAQEQEVTAAFKVLEDNLPPQLTATEDYRHIRAEWVWLQKEGLEWAMGANLAAHTNLIEHMQFFEQQVADEYLLIIDTDIASYYLIDISTNRLVHVLERLGRLRAYGTGGLTRKQLTEDQRVELKVMMAELANTLKHFNLGIDSVGRHNPAIRSSLQVVNQDIDSSVRLVTDLVTTDILTGRFATPPETFLNAVTVQIDRSYAQLYDTLLPMAKRLTQAYIDRAKQELSTSVGISLLIFLLVVYLSVSIYYSIINNIQSLVRSARAFASGNLKERVKLNTRDEISQVGDSFNEMADGFNAMLEARKRAEELLSKESYKNESLLRAASDGIHILDLEGNVLQVNDAFCRMLGYTAAELLTMNAAQWEAQWTAAQIKANIGALGSNAAMLETRHRRRDGSIIDAEVSIVKVNVDGRQLVYCSSRDVTERKRAERALVEGQERLNAVIETALDAVVQMDAAGIITGWNSQAEKIFGWSREEAVGRMMHETIIPPQYREAHADGLKRFLLTGEGPILNSRVELLGMHRDGHEFPIELSITVIKAEGKYEFNGFIHDITNRKKSDDLIWKQANFDTLTGLPNRRMFYDRLEQDIKKADRAEFKIALLFIDLDKFKEVNDTLGHSMGDILLVETARRIGDCVRETDTVARLGGDEFIVILAELDDIGSAERVAECILRKLAEPFRLGDEVAYVTASIGITLYPDDATATENLLKNADQAMYTAKEKGRNRFSYFTQSMQQAAQARLRLINELRGALAANQFRVYYQPVVDMATGRINKAEALIRWQHPELGLVSPAQFIPLAEETGLIVGIGDWVFKESARQLKHWRALHNTGLQVSVNMSPVQFHSTSPYQAWSAYLQELGLPGQSMVIEITEGLLLDADADVTGKLLEFHDVGMQVAIDDFGTGYSSLSYIKKFDIDYLKIDQSFVRNLATDPEDLALSEAIIVMAHKLGLKVIAEGVETEAQCKLLSAAGCDYTQGYLFSRPVPTGEFEELLKGGLSLGPKCRG
ncbi:MAG: EAL domain-containing protein [Sideroxyarcus sp.]|nr:EAL domain-containing protein [Sideroxyarcus sp.]